MRIWFCKFHCLITVGPRKPSVNLSARNQLGLNDKDHISYSSQSLSDGMIRFSSETSVFERDSSEQSIDHPLRCGLKQTSSSEFIDTSKKKKVQWMDSINKELKEIKEYEPSEKYEEDEDEEG